MGSCLSKSEPEHGSVTPAADFEAISRPSGGRITVVSPFAAGNDAIGKPEVEAAPANDKLSDVATTDTDTPISLYDTLTFSTEKNRLDAVMDCGLLDTPAESRFDVITELVAKLFGVPVCLVSLMDFERDWFKSITGPFASCSRREGSFCSYVTVPDTAEVLIVADSTKDARFSANVFVTGPPGIRFYAGAPLVTSTGQRLGTLCIVDFKPHYFAASAYNVLCNFAEVVAREMERESVEARLTEETKTKAGPVPEREHAKHVFRVPAADEPVVMLNVSKRGWLIFYANQAYAASLDMPLDAIQGQRFWDLFRPANTGIKLQALKEQANNGEHVTVLALLNSENKREGQEKTVYEFHFWLASRGQFHNSAPVGIPGFAPDERSAEPTPNLPINSLWFGTPKIISGQTKRKSGAKVYNVRAGSFGAIVLSSHLPPKLQGVKLGPLIGKGSYGKVYRGDIGEKAVSVKVLEVPAADSVTKQPESSDSSFGGKVGLQEAILEAALSRRLAHPNIIPTLDYAISQEEYGHRVWFLQHFCEKGGLYDILDTGMLRQSLSLASPPSLSKILATAHDIASALQYLHENDILHGDLSGNNVLISTASNARGFVALVGDFGLSRALPSAIHTQSLGTVTHMPPEVLMEGLLTKAADSYAFGVLLWEMWSGKRAWAGTFVASVIFKVTQKGESLSVPEDCPEALGNLMAACIEKEHTLRPTFNEIVKSLEQMERALALN